MSKAISFLVAFVAVLSFSASGAAQVAYPAKPVKIIVGYAPGGQTDVIVRTLVDLMEKQTGASFVVENKPGGTSGIAVNVIAKADPDGYNLGAISDSPLVRIPHMRKVTYDPMNDVIPMIRTNVSVAGLVVKADSPFKTFKDFVEYAKKNPGKLSYSHPGSGSSPHLGMGALEVKYGIKCSAVPFKGDAEMITATLGGHVMAGAGTTGGFGPHVKSGDLRLLAVFGKQRIKFFPDAPTLIELGYDVVAESSFLIVAPKGTPKPVLDKFESMCSQAMQQPAFAGVADKLWTVYEPILKGEALKKSIMDDNQFSMEIIKTMGIQE